MTSPVAQASHLDPVGIEGVPKIGGDIATMAPQYLSDESRLQGHADTVFLPRNEAEVAACMEHCRCSGTDLTVSSGRTGLCGGAVPWGGAVMSMERMADIRGMGHDGHRPFVRVGPGITLRDLESFLSRGEWDTVPELTPGFLEAYLGTGLRYPVDPTEQGGSIGGNVAANASGARTFSQGPTRDWIRRLRVILPWGDILEVERGRTLSEEGDFVIQGTRTVSLLSPETSTSRKVKNATGLYGSRPMDLMDLFIGSEGILGTVVEIDLWLQTRIEQLACMVFLEDESQVLGMVRRMREDPALRPGFIEYIDEKGMRMISNRMAVEPGFLDIPPLPFQGPVLFFEIPMDGSLDQRMESLGAIAAECDVPLDRTWCAYEPREVERLKRLRHAVPETVFGHISELKRKHPKIHKLGTDMSVPDEHLDGMMRTYHRRLDAEGLDYIMFGHIGDNHLHIEILLRDDDEFDRGQEAYLDLAREAVRLGGSPSAEHGVGKLKRDYVELLLGEDGVHAIRAIKKVMDPENYLNPGNMVDI